MRFFFFTVSLSSNTTHDYTIGTVDASMSVAPDRYHVDSINIPHVNVDRKALVIWLVIVSNTIVYFLEPLLGIWH